MRVSARTASAALRDGDGDGVGRLRGRIHLLRDKQEGPLAGDLAGCQLAGEDLIVRTA